MKPFEKKEPCKSCPYRVDSKLQLWSVEEFRDLLKREREMMGSFYGCHKRDGNVCVGWLMYQDKRGFPSLRLRMMLSKHSIGRDYLDGLSCPVPVFDSVEEMCEANYPGIV